MTNDQKKQNDMRDMLKIIVKNQEIQSQKTDLNSKKLDNLDVGLKKTNETLNKHSETLDKHSESLDKHSESLDKHSEILDKQSEILDKHSETLDKHSKSHINHSEGFIDNSRTLKSHAEISHKIGLNLEEIRSDQKFILEIVLSNQARLSALTRIETKVEGHEHRISAVEHFVRKHPN